VDEIPDLSLSSTGPLNGANNGANGTVKAAAQDYLELRDTPAADVPSTNGIEPPPAPNGPRKGSKRRKARTPTDGKEPAKPPIPDPVPGPTPEVALPRVAVTLITNEVGLATKVFWQNKDGKIEGRAAASIYQGKIETVEVAGIEGFLALRRSLTSEQALTYGVTGLKEARLVTQRDLRDKPAVGAISRTRDSFGYQRGRPGVSMGDCDVRPGYPPLHWKELDAILCSVFPPLREVARCWTQSSTSSIRTLDRTDEIGMGGWRLYFIVDDASRIPAICDLIYQALWANGYGYCRPSKSGQILDKAPIDSCVAQPERIDFCAPPFLGPGLERTETETVILPGKPMLETSGLSPPKPMGQWRKNSRELKAARRALKPEAAKQRAAYEAEVFAATLAQRPDANADTVRAAIRRAVEERALSGPWLLHCQDGSIVSVSDLFADPAKWDGCLFADPLEPTYRNDNRIAWACMRPEIGEPFIFSHAHGGQRYRLVEEPENGEEPLLPPPGHPMGCARKFVEAKFHHPERPLLVQQGGQFYHWDGTCWPTLDDKEVRTAVYRFTERSTYLYESSDGTIERRAWQPTTRKTGDFIDALRAVAHERTTIRTPSWLSGDELYQAKDIVACSNGLVHIPTRTLIPHTPRFYVHNAVPFAFEPLAPVPEQWLKFLDDLWGEDEESIRCLQEIFGYLVTGDTTLQKMFLIVGPKRAGKGTIARVLRAMLGEHNVAGPTLSSFGTNFGLEPLIGKTLAVVSDARIGSSSDTSIIGERLLSISGEDTLTVDRKYKEPVSLQFPTRIAVLSNELPRFNDASGALASRFVVLLLTNSFYGRENPALTQTLLTELPAIFNWALDGAASLSKRGYFLPPKASEEAVRELEDLSSPIGAFVRERCEVGPGHSIAVEALYAEFRSWCSTEGRDRIPTIKMFGRDLRAIVPGIRKTRPRDGDARFYVYEGIGRKNNV
jgi:putative DNA primase/helicase